MKIKGIQKLTLLDYPEKLACTIFTYGCNLRCPFCQNGSLVLENRYKNNNISKNELLEFLEKRKNILDGICISGGEPLINEDIYELFKEIKSLGYLIKLDTNGTFPEKIEKAIKEKLVDYIAMDIKNSKNKYLKTSGINNLDISKIEKSVEILKNSNIDYEFRTTIIEEYHDKKDIEEIGNWLKGSNKYFLQYYTYSEDIIGEKLTKPNKETMDLYKNILEKNIKTVEIRG